MTANFGPLLDWLSGDRERREHHHHDRYVFGLRERQFVCYFHFVNWSCFSIGFHVDVASPNIELHLPFGFIRIGWQGVQRYRPRWTIGRRWQ